MVSRHLINFTELTLIAAISAGVTYTARLHPGFAFPVYLLRGGIALYFAYVLGVLEGKKTETRIQATAFFVGYIGASWDDWYLTSRAFPSFFWKVALAFVLLLLVASARFSFSFFYSLVSKRRKDENNQG